MARTPLQKNSGRKITPLWIVAAFLTLTEVVLGYALTKVTGGVQVALTVFVIAFALMVAASFFLILWSRPWVFYAPSEYGDIDPKHFMSAMREAPAVANQIELAKSLEENPDNLEMQFELIDSMADEAQCQWIILMAETGKDAPRFGRHVYESKEGGGGCGTFDSFSRNNLEGTGIVRTSGSGRFFTLTDKGRLFAEWLKRKGRKCDYFWTQIGHWGSPKPDGAAEMWAKDIQAGREPGVGSENGNVERVS